MEHLTTLLNILCLAMTSSMYTKLYHPSENTVFMQAWSKQIFIGLLLANKPAEEEEVQPRSTFHCTFLNHKILTFILNILKLYCMNDWIEQLFYSLTVEGFPEACDRSVI